MSRVAFVFSGQGAQFSGMGKDLYDSSPKARQVFDVCESIRPGTISQCFYGSNEELALTVNTQPCIFAVSVAAAESFREKGIEPQAVAGFSAGEIPALTFGGMLSVEQGFMAVIRRAELMHEAASEVNGGMAAVLRLDAGKVEQLCKNAGVYPVNYNCPSQTVVAGEVKKLSEFVDTVTKSGGRAIVLKVSGAFHSPYMDSAAIGFEKYLNGIEFGSAVIPVYANLTALPYKSSDAKKTLAAQINSPVLWQKTIENMISDGIEEFMETGPGNVLSGLISKIKI